MGKIIEKAFDEILKAFYFGKVVVTQSKGR
jgi:hypothetical protein